MRNHSNQIPKNAFKGARNFTEDGPSHRNATTLEDVEDDNDVVKLSQKYKDRKIELLENKLCAVGYKGWSSVFASHCSRFGKWYYEVVLVESSRNLHFVGKNPDEGPGLKGRVRVGYACRYQNYASPVGLGSFGYVISDTDGTVVNGSVKHPYAWQFGIGDVVGCYLNLEQSNYELPNPGEDIRLRDYVRRGILCDPNNPPPRELSYGSYVAFSINGRRFKKCEIMVWEGEYHPAITLYMGAAARVNFGPKFIYPPPEDFKPCCDMGKPMIP